MTKSLDKLVDSLEERVKELNCLYEIEEILYNPDLTIEEVLQNIVLIIPPAFQYPAICHAKIIYHDQEYTSPDYIETQWVLNNDILVQDRHLGEIRVVYDQEKPQVDIGPFLKEEKELLNSISTRLGQHLMYQRLKLVFDKWETTKQDMSTKRVGEWEVILELLRRTDTDLYIRISRKMLNFLIWSGVEEAEELLQKFNPYYRYEQEEVLGESNVPLQKIVISDLVALSKETFKVARTHLSNAKILSRIQKWMQEDKTAFLVRAVTSNSNSLTDIAEAIYRYYQLNPDGMELTPSTKIGVRAALIRRIFSDQLEFVNIAKNYVRVSDFHKLLKRMIFPVGSHGKVGGKSAGVFLASRILKSSEHYDEMFKDIKMPKTWYVSSDSMLYFMHYNNLEEIMEQKYKPVKDVRKEYGHVVQLFKTSHFPEDLTKALFVVLDDFGDMPIVVRSSSLLEDRLGSAFSGKYKSLFLANQGSKKERLEALTDAISEVYASTIGPDPIQYRAERGLLDFHEEMGIMIQEVVGKQVGDYFLPAFAGVAFSNNEFRWSPRIRREDGLIRMVPGLGTRAVDRVADDYPVLIAPGQPGLRTNVSPDEVIRYAPVKVDVVNLKKNRFETIDIQTLFKQNGNQYPMVEKIVSVLEHNNLRKPGFNTDFKNSDLCVTFDGLFTQTPFIQQMKFMLKELQNKMATPVDVEFAHNGDHLYLLQCRPQSYSRDSAPAEIPGNIPKEQLIFSAERYISNGRIDDIQYIVYVVPEKYNELQSLDEMKEIGRAVGRLNKILPQRKFILMGPGRWGSRGDIKMGVNVTYSDINHTAMLVEIARKKGNYVPDLSFGTHFFQDLVEASIRYLPLYPDEEKNAFHEDFLNNSPNSLGELLPQYSRLSEIIRVINLPQTQKEACMRILMNGDMNLAVGILCRKGDQAVSMQYPHSKAATSEVEHWKWRQQMAQRIADQLPVRRFAVQDIFLLGNTARPASDIDLIVHFLGNAKQKLALENWLEGWSLALDEINFLRTGFKAGGLLDVKYITDKKAQTEQTVADMFNIINLSSVNKLELKSGE